jgi:hypothetical protein
VPPACGVSPAFPHQVIAGSAGWVTLSGYEVGGWFRVGSLATPTTGANYWSGSSGSQPRGIVLLQTSGLWVAYLCLEDRPGLSPITTVGRFDRVEAAQLATDEVWGSR